MENKNYIKAQKVLNPQETYYQIIYKRNDKNCYEEGRLSYKYDEFFKMHVKIMELENKLNIKATYEGFNINDFQGHIKIAHNNLDTYYENIDLYKEIEELKNQLAVSEDLNKELHKANKNLCFQVDNNHSAYTNMCMSYKKLETRTRQNENLMNIAYTDKITLTKKYNEVVDQNINLNEYLTQHKNNIYNLQDKINKLEDDKYKLELKLAEYSFDSIILDEIRKEYNKTKCIPRYVFNGNNYVEENEFLKINMELNYEKQRNQNINKPLNNVGDIKVKILIDDLNLKNAMDAYFMHNIHNIRYPGGP